MKDGLFHPKVWLFENCMDSNDTVEVCDDIGTVVAGQVWGKAGECWTAIVEKEENPFCLLLSSLGWGLLSGCDDELCTAEPPAPTTEEPNKNWIFAECNTENALIIEDNLGVVEVGQMWVGLNTCYTVISETTIDANEQLGGSGLGMTSAGCDDSTLANGGYRWRAGIRCNARRHR